MDIPIQYIDLLRNRLLQQADVYYAFKSNRCSSVSYKSYTDKTYGVRDENDTNRLRLSYYLLFEKIDDEEVIAAAKALHDPYAVQLKAEYVKWKDSIGMK